MTSINKKKLLPTQYEQGKFSIELLPNNNKNNVLEFLSNLSVVDWLNFDDFINIWFKRASFKNLESFVVPESFETYINNLKDMRVYSSVWIHISKLNSQVNLFEILDILTVEDYIIITTKDGNILLWKFDEYLSKGVKALKIQDKRKKREMMEYIKMKSKFYQWKSILRISINNENIGFESDWYCVINKSGKRLVGIKDSNLVYLNYDNNEKSYLPEKEFYNLSFYGKIKQISTDENNNFYFIISEEQNYSKLRILNRKTLEEVQDAYDGITEIVYMSHEHNKLFCKDDKENLRVVCISTNNIPRGYVDKNPLDINNNKLIKTAAEEVKDKLDIIWISINLENKNEQNLAKDIIKKIWDASVWEKTFKEIFDDANDVESIEEVKKLFLQIKKHPDLINVPETINEVESEINKKYFSMLLKKLKSDTKKLGDDLKNLESEENPENILTDLINFKERLDEIEKIRWQIPNTDSNLDNEISSIKKEIERNISEIRSKNLDDIKKSLEEYFEKIQDYLSLINYLPQITSVYNKEEYIEAIKIIEILDEDERKTQTRNIEDIIASHIARIEKVKKSEKSEKQRQIEEKISEINTWISNIKRIIASIDNIESLKELQNSDPLVLKIKNYIETIPKEYREEMTISLDNAFKKREQEIRINEFHNKTRSVSIDEYGIDVSLYFSNIWQKSIWFKLEWSRTPEGNIKLALHYDDGTVFDIDSYLQNPGRYALGMIFINIPTHLSQEDFLRHQRDYNFWLDRWKKQYEEMRKRMSEIRNDNSKKEEYENLKEKYKNHLEKFKSPRILEYFATALANKLDLNPRSHYSLPDPRFIVLDEEREIFRKISAGFVIQKKEQKWIEILEWDPGLWKTMMIEQFGAMTNREVVRIQCSKMDPSDLFFSPQLKAWETSRQQAEWIKIMQKPWVIILFDEIDKLDPQCFERLHRLFDSGRSIYDPQIGTIKAHSDCIFAGTRNSYEILSNPIVSRSSIIQINAPSEKNEAYKIAKYTGIDYFKNIDFDKFSRFYGEESFFRGEDKDNELTRTLGNVRFLVKLFQNLREKQKSENYQEKFEFEVSYRDAEQIFLRYNQLWDKSFSEVIEEVLVPKARAVVSNLEDKDIQENIVRGLVKESKIEIIEE